MIGVFNRITIVFLLFSIRCIENILTCASARQNLKSIYTYINFETPLLSTPFQFFFLPLPLFCAGDHTLNRIEKAR